VVAAIHSGVTLPAIIVRKRPDRFLIVIDGVRWTLASIAKSYAVDISMISRL
jgi:hypothetical protein